MCSSKSYFFVSKHHQTKPGSSNHLASFNRDTPLAARRNRFVMGDQHQCRSEFLVQLEHQLHHRFAGCKVQAAGGLVGQQHGRLHHKGSGQRHALLLSARKHLGVMRQPFTQAHALEHFGGHGPGVFAAGQLQRQHDVFQRRQIAQQLEALKHETNFLRAQRSAVVFAQGKNVLPGQPDRALGWSVESGNDRQQCAFARARSTDNGRCFTRCQRKVDITQNG